MGNLKGRLARAEAQVAGDPPDDWECPDGCPGPQVIIFGFREPPPGRPKTPADVPKCPDSCPHHGRGNRRRHRVRVIRFVEVCRPPDDAGGGPPAPDKDAEG